MPSLAKTAWICAISPLRNCTVLARWRTSSRNWRSSGGATKPREAGSPHPVQELVEVQEVVIDPPVLPIQPVDRVHQKKEGALGAQRVPRSNQP